MHAHTHTRISITKLLMGQCTISQASLLGNVSTRNCTRFEQNANDRCSTNDGIFHLSLSCLSAIHVHTQVQSKSQWLLQTILCKLGEAFLIVFGGKHHKQIGSMICMELYGSVGLADLGIWFSDMFFMHARCFQQTSSMGPSFTELWQESVLNKQC